MIRLGVRPEELLLPRLVGVVPPGLVAVFFGLEKGDEVDSRPDLFARQFTIDSSVAFFRRS